MTDNQPSTRGPSPQEKNGFLHVTPAPGKPQSCGSQTPVRSVKRPFGGGETTGEPLIKRSCQDQNGDRSHPRERKPRTLDAATLIEHLGPTNQGTLEEVKARIASATPSNPSGQYNTPRSFRRTKPVKPVVTAKPTAPKSLRDAPALPSDTSPKARPDLLGSIANPVVCDSGLEEPDRDLLDDSRDDRRHHLRTGPYSVAGGFMDDERSSYSSLIEHPGRDGRLSPGRKEAMPESRNRRRWEGRTQPYATSELSNYDDTRPPRMPRGRCRERATRYHDRSNSCLVRSRSRSRSPSREQNDDRYRGDHASKPLRQPLIRRHEVIPDVEQDNLRTAPRHHPSRAQPGQQGRQRRAVSPRDELRERLARSQSRERQQNPEQDELPAESWSHFESADPPLDPRESLGVTPGEYTDEQELSLFKALISIYKTREKIAELTFNQKRLQYEFDNKRAVGGRGRSKEQ